MGHVSRAAQWGLYPRVSALPNADLRQALSRTDRYQEIEKALGMTNLGRFGDGPEFFLNRA